MKSFILINNFTFKKEVRGCLTDITGCGAVMVCLWPSVHQTLQNRTPQRVNFVVHKHWKVQGLPWLLQWLRIHLAMPGARVWSWDPMCHRTRPMRSKWRAHVLQSKSCVTRWRPSVPQLRPNAGKHIHTYIHTYHTRCPGNQDGMQTLTNETNCITSEITSLKREGKKGIDRNNFGKYVLTGYNKATKRRTLHKHCTRVDKVTSYGSIGERLWNTLHIYLGWANKNCKGHHQ